MFSTIAIIGPGTVSGGMAQVCALRGFETALHDVTPEIVAVGRERIRASVQKGVDFGQTSPAAAGDALVHLRAAANLDGVAGVDLVIDAAPEDLVLKRDWIQRLDALVGPQCLLASNTSSLSITALAGDTARPERCLGLYFFNPACSWRW